MAVRWAPVALALAAALLVACHAFSEEAPLKKRVLVLLDNSSIRSSHSLFFRSLTERGYKLDFRAADDSSLKLEEFGEYLYYALVIFAPKTDSFGGSLDTAAILDFIDAGHDLILVAAPGASDAVRDIASECGVDLEEDDKAVVVDHFTFADIDLDTDHTLITSTNYLDASSVTGLTKPKAPILYRGLGMTTSPTNDLVLHVLKAPATALSVKPGAEVSKVPSLVGDSIVLVAAMQARNNARAVISGSLELFSDKFFLSPVKVSAAGKAASYPVSGNADFAAGLSKWAFHEQGHLRASNVKHHRVGETEEPAVYRIMDHLEYSMEIHEWTGKEWGPYKGTDVQVEFYMMSAYVRKTLETKGDGIYYTTFQVPDVYGVFQFKVNYNRPGYTVLSLAKQIPVRPYRHNEYERFIGAAYPYYASSFSMLFGFVIFGIVFLYNK